MRNQRRRRVTIKSGSRSTTFPRGYGTTALKITAQVRARREACCRIRGATKTEDRKSLGTIKVSRRVCGRAAKTGHFSNGTMAAHKLCKLLSLRQALHPGNDNYRRERGSGDAEHQDICVRIRNGRTGVTAWIRAPTSRSEFPTLRPEGSDGNRNGSGCLRLKIKVETKDE